MNYEQLKQRCNLIQVSVAELTKEVGITLDGLKKGLNSQSLALRYVVPLCSALCISPDEFFGVEHAGDVNYGSMNKNGKKQIIHNQSVPEELKSTIQMLKEQLEAKDLQIKTKDEQIAQLISKL